MPRRHAYSESERAAVYKVIAERRDMRHFAGGSIDEETLRRLLEAAHMAPSVGLMQPWRFVRILDAGLRLQVHEHVETERRATAEAIGERADEFMRLKVQGILDCSEVLVVAVGDERDQHIFGRRTMPYMDLASVACAIQNLWLAARAEGLGMGWVSMFEPDLIRDLVGLPDGAEPVGVLCLGPVHEFYDRPMLELQRWANPRPLEELLRVDRWG